MVSKRGAVAGISEPLPRDEANSGLGALLYLEPVDVLPQSICRNQTPATHLHTSKFPGADQLLHESATDIQNTHRLHPIQKQFLHGQTSFRAASGLHNH